MLQIPSLVSQHSPVEIAAMRRTYDILLNDEKSEAHNESNFAMELHFLEDNTDRLLAQQENPAFSMMGYGAEKLQGELVLKTQNLKSNQTLRFGWLYTDKSDSQTYDGLVIQSVFNAEKPEQMKFKAADVWSSQKVDVLSNGLKDLNMDEKNDWIILADESSVICSENETSGSLGDTSCEIRVRFSRDMNTADEDDLQLTPGSLQEFSASAFYLVSEPDLPRVKHASGHSGHYQIQMGALSLATTTIATAAALASITLLSF